MEKYYGIKVDNQQNWCQICNKLPDTQVKSWRGGRSHLCTLLLNWRSYQCLEWRIFTKSQQFQYCFVSMLNAISVSYWAARRKIDKVIEPKWMIRSNKHEYETFLSTVCDHLWYWTFTVFIIKPVCGLCMIKHAVFLPIFSDVCFVFQTKIKCSN